MRILLTTLFTLSVILGGCGSSKDSAKDQQNSTTETTESTISGEANSTTSAGSSTSSSITNTQNENMSENDQKQEAPKYRLIVSFISIGEGTDPDAKDIMDAIVNKWSSSTGSSITSNPIPWGREGEVDFCFSLNELSAEDQAKMAREMREAFVGNQLVQISEFQASTYER